MENLAPNPQKKLIVKIGEGQWYRYPIKTHFITQKDTIDQIIQRYILPHLLPSDIVVFGQKIISLIQGRVIYKKDLKVGFWAKFLSRFAKKTPYGFSVGNPLKMQVAINMAGLPRIFFAGICGAFAKLFGVSGVFYRLAGHQISQLDGFYGEAFKEYADIGILGPKDCDKLCNQIKEKYGFSAAVADINDLGGNILGRSSDLKGKEKHLLEILKDNPAGQSDQQTPIVIIRAKND
jgi:hypothetical protein